nr:T-complex protein 1 subunit delta [Seculamonas ecuadoriensis]
MSSPAPAAASSNSHRGERLEDRGKEKDVRQSNITAAKAVADAVRTSLGPRGMDKMVSDARGEVTVTNDGATILQQLEVAHPTARMLVELSKAQDVEAGDGTTSVVVLAGSLLDACSKLLAQGVHPTIISEAFGKAVVKADEILTGMGVPLDLNDTNSLVLAATTSLSSKVVYQQADLLSKIAVDAVMHVADIENSNVDLNDVRVLKKLGGTIDDTELINGIVFKQKASHAAGGPTRIQNAKIGLIQFCLSAPKTDMDNSVVVHDYHQMDRLMEDERKYILRLVRAIKQTGCNVLLIQKSILRDAVSDLSLNFLAKAGILVVRDIERTEIEFISKTLGCKPVATVQSFTAEKLGTAELVEEISTGEGKIIKMTGCPHSKTTSILIRGSNKLVLEEADRSLHDALCVVRSLVKRRFLICGGGAPEIELSIQLQKWAKTLSGMESYCVRAFAEALEIIPVTLAENAGLHPVSILTELRNRHVAGNITAGINVRRGTITDMNEESVLQPLLTNLSAINLATETVRLILKIDDIMVVP